MQLEKIGIVLTMPIFFYKNKLALLGNDLQKVGIYDRI
jgi:hypothetical protein